MRSYGWRCMHCKACERCGDSGHEQHLLFCDACDRGYHTFCLTPALKRPPTGRLPPPPHTSLSEVSDSHRWWTWCCQAVGSASIVLCAKCAALKAQVRYEAASGTLDTPCVMVATSCTPPTSSTALSAASHTTTHPAATPRPQQQTQPRQPARRPTAAAHPTTPWLAARRGMLIFFFATKTTMCVCVLLQLILCYPFLSLSFSFFF